MTFDYSRIAALARAQLDRFGQTVTLRTVGSGTYDPESSTVDEASTTNVKRKAALFNYERGLTEREGTLVQAGDKRCLMEAGIVPTPDQQVVTADGIVYGIVSIQEVNPAGTPVLYELHLRRG